MKQLLTPRDCLLCILMGYTVPSLPLWDMGLGAAVYMGVLVTGFAGLILSAPDKGKKEERKWTYKKH